MVAQSLGKNPYCAKMGVGLVGSPREMVRGCPAGMSYPAVTVNPPCPSTVISQFGSAPWLIYIFI